MNIAMRWLNVCRMAQNYKEMNELEQDKRYVLEI